MSALNRIIKPGSGKGFSIAKIKRRIIEELAGFVLLFAAYKAHACKNQQKDQIKSLLP
jgi:hypothetical protein